MSLQRMNPGLNIYHDVRSEGFMARSLGEGTVEVTIDFTPSSKQHRTYFKNNNQGEYPKCTAFGTLTDLACSPITYPGKNPLGDPNQYYADIQAEDRAQGRQYAEGATTLAAMEVAKRNGWISAYYWGWTMDTAHRTIVNIPMVWGTWWYSSMFNPDAEGIIRITTNAVKDGGHLYCIDGYDHRRDLWTIEQTWGKVTNLPGIKANRMKIGGDALYRLLREDGEFTVITEVKAA